MRGSLAPNSEAVQSGSEEGASPNGVEPSPTPTPSASDEDASSADSTELAYPRSTLDAIGGRVVAAARPEDASSPPDKGAESPKRRPRLRPGRIAVEGPDDIGQDLRLTALRLAAACDGGALDDALAETAASTAPVLRAAAFEAIARRAAAMPLSPGLTEIAVVALKDREPPVRAAAVRSLAARSDAAHRLAPLLDDPDAAVRAAALKAVAAADPEKAARGFRDPSAVVRGAALQAVAERGHDNLVAQAMRALVDGGFTDTLNQACRRYPVARQVLLALLREADSLSPQGLLMILQVLGQPQPDMRAVGEAPREGRQAPGRLRAKASRSAARSSLTRSSSRGRSSLSA